MELWQRACISLKEAAELQGKTPEQIAEQTGLKASNIERIFAAKYPPPLDVFFKITFACNKRITISSNEW